MKKEYLQGFWHGWSSGMVGVVILIIIMILLK